MMDEQQVKVLEDSIQAISATIVKLRSEQAEISALIEDLNKAKFELSKLLPHNKRIEQLFK